MTGQFLDHALAYAAAGIPVLPLHPRSKVPATVHGKDDATLDPDQIRAWWSAAPLRNIGVRPPAGFVVIDEDVQNGGDTALAELIGWHAPLPETWTARTGSGGRHIWLRAPGPFRGKLCTGVDIKHNSGYLVAPPSIHPNGRRYQWLNRAPIAHAPNWLRPLLAPPAPRPRTPFTSNRTARNDSGDALVRFVASAVEGNRNHALFWAACRAVESGSMGAIRDALKSAAIATGITDTAAEATLRSAESRA